MTNYAEKLAKLDTKAGRVHTLDDWTRVRLKAEHSPEAVMDDDLTIIGYFDGPGHVARAVERRRLAIHPVTAVKSAPTALAAPAAHVALLPTVEEADDFSTDAGLTAWAEKNDMAAVPVLIWRAFVKTARENRLALEARVAELESSERAPSSLETRVKALEARGYQGVWAASTAYAGGAMVTFDGSIWHANIESQGVRPGSNNSWTLAAKRGRDGKDLR